MYGLNRDITKIVLALVIQRMDYCNSVFAAASLILIGRPRGAILSAFPDVVKIDYFPAPLMFITRVLN